jgi:XTP/dITP diphosphohydrolase
MSERPRLVLATANAGKVTELRRILQAASLPVDLVGTDAYPDLPEVVETGATFAENAVLKAVSAAEHTGHPAVADDSGLCVDILGGSPGIFSARWCGRHGNDAANLDLVLRQLSDVPDAARGAAFRCAAALAVPGSPAHTVDGMLRGRLIRSPRGTGGFGYDPIFVPEGESRTTAELSAGEKDAISHRGRAFRALVPVVAAALSPSLLPSATEQAVDVRVRPALPGDLPAVQALNAALLDFDARHFADLNLGWAHGPDGDAYFRSRISGGEGICLVAEAGAVVVGYLAGALRTGETWRLHPRTELENMYVAADRRRSGVGRQLATAFAAWSRTTGARQILVEAFHGNEAAIAFYASLGYAPAGVALHKDL